MSTLLLEGGGGASLHVGSVVGGRYVIERLIGRGGFGSVFQARHTGTGQGVAIKTLGAGLESNDVAVRRFFQEARVTAGLRHPNTIRVFDFGQEDSGMLFLAMELLTGETLKQALKARVQRGKVFSEAEAVEIGVAVSKSLAEAHRAGLVHRDLKPDNIFLHRVEGDDTVVKVLDFGIVKLADSELTMGSDSGAPGTPAYMSPEQVSKAAIDGRSDLYSLGVVLYSLVTGGVPFRGQQAMQTLYMHVHDPVPDIRRRARTPISEAFAALVHRTLAKDPSDRPQDARELRGLLLSCLGRHEPEDDLHVSPHPLLQPAFLSGPSRAVGELPSELWESTDDTRDLQPAQQPAAVRGPRRGLRWMAIVAAAVIAVIGGLAYRQRARPDPAVASAPARVALLPFENATAQPELDFARAGLPFLLGTELSRVPSVGVIGYYHLRSALGGDDQPRSAWLDAARRSGAELVVYGRLESDGERVRVSVVLADVDGEVLEQLESTKAVADVPRAVQAAASAIASRALGKTVSLAERDEAFEFQRLFTSGVAALESQRFGVALELLTHAVKLDATSTRAFYHLALASWWSSHPASQTKGYIDRSIELGPQPADRAFLDGLMLLVDRRYEDSITVFARGAEAHPDHRELAYGLSEALFHGGHPREGVAVYRKLVATHPSFTLGVNHALTYGLAHGHREILAWALPLTLPGLDRARWEARVAIADRDYPRAVERLLDEAEGSRERSPRTSAQLEPDLFGAYVAAQQLELAQMSAERSDNESIDGKIRLLTLAIARGDERRLGELRASLATIAAGLWPGIVALEDYTGVVRAELAQADAARLQAMSATYQRLLPAELEADPRTRMTQRLLRARWPLAGDTPDRDPGTPELEALDRALVARAAGHALKAGDAFTDTTRASPDGRFALLLFLMAAEQYRAAGADALVVERCREVIAPRLVQWEWGGAIAPCLAYTAEAEVALGRAEAARATAARLRALRRSAADPWVAIAEKALSAAVDQP